MCLRNLFKIIITTCGLDKFTQGIKKGKYNCNK
ncbi:UNVERIFIED_CONTAM: hypothetical protein ABIC26_001425 [Paenibacillus sp. PvR008]